MIEKGIGFLEHLLASTLGEKNPDKSRFGSAFEAGLFGAPLRSQDTEMSEVTAFFFLSSKKSSNFRDRSNERTPRTKKTWSNLYRFEEENLVKGVFVGIRFPCIFWMDFFTNEMRLFGEEEVGGLMSELKNPRWASGREP